jgi:hypothetical protein
MLIKTCRKLLKGGGKRLEFAIAAKQNAGVLQIKKAVKERNAQKGNLILQKNIFFVNLRFFVKRNACFNRLI